MLWIVFSPFSYQDVSEPPVNLDGTGAREVEVVFTVSNVVLIPLFIPALVTGLALLFLLTRKKRRTANALVIWGLSAILLVFCVGNLFLGLYYAPTAIALIVTAVIFGPGRGLPQVE